MTQAHARVDATVPARAIPEASRAPRPPFAFATIALLVGAVTIAAAYATGGAILAAVARRGLDSPLAAAITAIAAALFIPLLVPGWAAMSAARRAAALARGGDVSSARTAVAQARSYAWSTLGYALAAFLLLAVALFLIANNLAVAETFFNLKYMGESAALIGRAFLVNVEVFCFAEVFILVWALVIVLARMAPGPAGRPLRLLATAYVDIFRALPAIIAIYLVGFGLPLTGLRIFDAVPQTAYAVLALTLIYGAYVSEVYRAGIEGVHPSQTAAARSLGLGYGQTLRYVVLPQAFRRVVPPLLNDFIGLQKDTALINVIGAFDAFNQAKMAASKHYNLSSVTTVAVLFILITIPQTRLVDRMLEAGGRRRP